MGLLCIRSAAPGLDSEILLHLLAKAIGIVNVASQSASCSSRGRGAGSRILSRLGLAAVGPGRRDWRPSRRRQACLQDSPIAHVSNCFRRSAEPAAIPRPKCQSSARTPRVIALPCFAARHPQMRTPGRPLSLSWRPDFALTASDTRSVAAHLRPRPRARSPTSRSITATRKKFLAIPPSSSAPSSATATFATSTQPWLPCSGRMGARPRREVHDGG